MARCSLCGTPLQPDETACSYCKHPVLMKKQTEETKSVQSSKSHPLFHPVTLILSAVLGIGLWYTLDPFHSTDSVLPPVQPWSTSEWSDETSAYNQTYSPDRPPASYDVLKFVRQYTKTLPETANYSKTTDVLETFSAIQFSTLDVFRSEVTALQSIKTRSNKRLPTRTYTIDFTRFISKGTSFQIDATETYQLDLETSQRLVTYDVRYNVRLHTDHLQIIRVVRTEVNA